MRPRKAALRRPLDRVFAAPSHIAVLRALLDSAEGMSGRQVARLAEVNNQACANALRRLEESAVVERQGSGQSQLIRLNRENVLVRALILPLLRGERGTFRALLDRLGELIPPRCLQAIVFGSVARGEEEGPSDLDLLLVVDGPTNRRSARERAGETRTRMWKEWGVRVNPITLTSHELEARRRRRDPLIVAILRDGVPIGRAGRTEAGHGGTRKAAAG